jgi:hypothetical protein
MTKYVSESFVDEGFPDGFLQPHVKKKKKRIDTGFEKTGAFNQPVINISGPV